MHIIVMLKVRFLQQQFQPSESTSGIFVAPPTITGKLFVFEVSRCGLLFISVICTLKAGTVAICLLTFIYIYFVYSI